MLRNVALAVALLLMGTSASQADWIIKTGEDPMSDQKWVAVGAPIGEFVLTFKCWKGGSTLLVIVVGKYDANVPYKDAVEVKMRVDKAEPVDLMMLSTEMAGSLTLQISSEVSDVVIPLLKQIGTAKNRIVLSLGSVVLTTSPKGAAKGVQQMISGCEIPEKTS